MVTFCSEKIASRGYNLVISRMRLTGTRATVGSPIGFIQLAR